MKVISRCHNFENRLTLIKLGRKYAYFWHEKSINPVKIRINKQIKEAFKKEDWEKLCEYEQLGI